jgi:hypothetical protein
MCPTPNESLFYPIESRLLKGKTMILPLHRTQLSSAKPRSGLQSISELLPLLLAQYELQARAQSQIAKDNCCRAGMKQASETKQSTFSWYQ